MLTLILVQLALILQSTVKLLNIVSIVKYCHSFTKFDVYLVLTCETTCPLGKVFGKTFVFDIRNTMKKQSWLSSWSQNYLRAYFHSYKHHL